MIQSRQRFNEYVSTFIAEFVTASDEKVQSFIQVKVEMTVKVSANKFMDFLFGHSVQILKFV